MCEPPESAVAKLPPEWHHTPWDEVELKKRSLLDRKCHHFANAIMPDEVELKKLGFVDSEGHHCAISLDEPR